MIDLGRLRCLHEVARQGGVSRAARELHLSPSAVSQQISKLESELGHPLLERSGRGIRLTESANVLVRHAAAVLSQLERAHTDLEALRGAIAGQLGLGAFPTAARGLVPGALGALRRAYPQLEIRLHELEPDQSLAMLLRGDLDVIVVQDWFNAPLVIPDGLSRCPLLDDEADVLVPSRHPFARQRHVRLSQLVNESWICWQPGSICADWLVLTLRQSGIEPTIAHTAAEHPTQLALVAAGLGVAMVPRLGRGPLPAGVKSVPVRPSLKRHVYALWRTDSTRRPNVGALTDALRAAARR